MEAQTAAAFDAARRRGTVKYSRRGTVKYSSTGGLSSATHLLKLALPGAVDIVEVAALCVQAGSKTGRQRGVSARVRVEGYRPSALRVVPGGGQEARGVGAEGRGGCPASAVLVAPSPLSPPPHDGTTLPHHRRTTTAAAAAAHL